MYRLNKFFYLIFIFLSLYACKSQKQLTQKKTPSITQDTSKVQAEKKTISDTVAVEKDSLTHIKAFNQTDIDSAEVADSMELHTDLIDTLLIIGVGDIMLGTNFPESHYLPPNHGKDLLKNVVDELKKGHLTFGNHEGVILNDGGDPKYCRNPDICYLFRSPEYLSHNLLEAGFDVLSLANNHAGDFGTPGRLNTMKILDSLGIHYAGLFQKPFTSFELDGIKYGFAAFSPNSGTQSILDIESAKSIVTQLDSLNDIVIISFHGGAEGKDYQKVTKKTEIFYGENRGNVYEFSHELIDAGADIIFGHGPHVSRAVEVYKKRLIAYSLGNFCTYARFNLSGPNGVAPIMKVYTDRKGEFLSGQIIPIKQVGSGIPVIDQEKVVIKLIRDLTENDFPESEIIIDDMGIIKYIKSEI